MRSAINWLPEDNGKSSHYDSEGENDLRNGFSASRSQMVFENDFDWVSGHRWNCDKSSKSALSVCMGGEGGAWEVRWNLEQRSKKGNEKKSLKCHVISHQMFSRWQQ